MSFQVKVWQEAIIIPTYGVGKPEKNPMFLEKRVYQGSSGVVYPHAVIEKIEDVKHDKTYQAIFLENQYLKIMVLPELGGRIQMAYDKVKERHFIYYNQVIKPALVGLTGPWISGGIEFNWPQHHRPSTFDPIDFTIEENEDGSKTVWVSEIERMFSTKGMAGFTLYPDKAYIEIKGVLYNRTNLPQTFLWWANPAVKVNDHYQSVFPPDVYAVFDHGKRDVSSFPIAKGTYYKVDYSPGTDISGYKNIPVPTSYMAIKSKYDFMGGYEHDTNGGLLHVANHHISPGKKQWTWGNGEFGYAWDRNLTDEDGPYIELMTGVFTDNQPDFSWIMPNEERRFKQYFMPYSEIGVVKNATTNAAVNLEYADGLANIMVYATAKYDGAKIELTYKGEVVLSETANILPEFTFKKEVEYTVENIHELKLTVYSATGDVLVAYQPEIEVETELPEPAIAAKDPKEIENNEQLYLTGLHIEQYRHATFSAKEYYEEALNRDSKDVRCNNALGLWYYKKGQFDKARPYFEKAISTLTQRNPNAYDGEAYYNLGLCETKLNNFEKAYEVFYKATWNNTWQSVAYLQLARLSTRKNNYAEALEQVNEALIRNWHGHSVRHLKAVLLRKLGKNDALLAFVADSLAIDKFSCGCLFEQYLLLKEQDADKAAATLNALKTLLRGNVHTYIEYAIDYMQAGLFEEVRTLLDIYVSEVEEARVYPMAYYFMAYAAAQLGQDAESNDYLLKGKKACSDFVFPNKLDELVVLQWVVSVQKDDSNAYYYLGNIWYANRQTDEAVSCWEQSININPDFATVWRNLSLAYFNKFNDADKSLFAMEKAYNLDITDARILMELDQLYKRLNYDINKRVDLLTKDLDITYQRDDLYLELATLYNQLGEYELAQKMISERQFHPWEGGEGKVVSQYLTCHIELAKLAITEYNYEKALDLLRKAEKYPDNLGEGKLYGAQENDIHYLKGTIYEYLGDSRQATYYFKLATFGLDEPVQAIFYNDQQPDKILYQGLAWQKLGELDRAEGIFNKLIDFGKAHLNDDIKIDYFAVSLPDLLVFDVDLSERNHIHCLYLIGLGLLGLGDYEAASDYFNKALKLNVNHQGAMIHNAMLHFLDKSTVLINK